MNKKYKFDVFYGIATPIKRWNSVVFEPKKIVCIIYNILDVLYYIGIVSLGLLSLVALIIFCNVMIGK